MRSYGCQVAILIFLCGVARGAVSTSQCDATPADEGWTLVQSFGELTVWSANGLYNQDFSNNCPSRGVCGSEAFTRSAQAFNARPTWFLEYRVKASGDRSEIPGGAPTVLAAGNSFGLLYWVAVARDQVKLLRDVDLPVLFLDVEAKAFHQIRLELDNSSPPTYRWYVDSVLVVEGLAEGVFPSQDASVTWQGRSWHLPTFNQWDYIRFGDIPEPASGDFDSDGQVNDFDAFYFAECAERSAGGEPAVPSCAWADFDSDNDVDCDDDAEFRDAWSGAGEAPSIACASAPALSPWSVIVLGMATTAMGAGVMQRRGITSRRQSGRASAAMPRPLDTP